MVRTDAVTHGSITKIPEIGNRVIVGIGRCRTIEAKRDTGLPAVRSAGIGDGSEIDGRNCDSGRRDARCAFGRAVADHETNLVVSCGHIHMDRGDARTAVTVAERPGETQWVVVSIAGAGAIELHWGSASDALVRAARNCDRHFIICRGRIQRNPEWRCSRVRAAREQCRITPGGLGAGGDLDRVDISFAVRVEVLHIEQSLREVRGVAIETGVSRPVCPQIGSVSVERTAIWI